jgi:hypothetical protein
LERKLGNKSRESNLICLFFIILQRVAASEGAKPPLRVPLSIKTSPQIRKSSIKTSPQIRKSGSSGLVNLLSDTEINSASVRSQPAFTGQAADSDSGTLTFIKTAAAFLKSLHIIRKVGMMVAAGSAGSGAAAALISSLDKDQILNVTKGDVVTTLVPHITS